MSSRDHNFFDGFARRYKMRPYGYSDTKYGRILLADSGEPIHHEGRIFYRTGYAIERGGLEIGNYHDYELNVTGGSHSDQDFRIHEALKHAKLTLAQTLKSGFYDDGRKQDFAPRPN